MAAVKVPVTFLSAHSPRKGALGLLAVPCGLPARTAFCRFFSYVDGVWGVLDLDYQGQALASLVDARANYRAWWVLGRNGELTESTAAGVRHEHIPGAGLGFTDARGYVSALKNIANQLYVCGYHRQVYTRRDASWISLADDILSTASGTGFLDIDGSAHDQLYAVGWNGEIFFYDGQRWQRDACPISDHLSSVRCLPDGEVWICSYAGHVLRGAFGHWTLIDTAGLSANWYCLEVHEGVVYLAGDGVLARVDGAKAVALDPLGRPLSTHRLHSRDGALWSVGEHDIVVLEDGVWREIVHPDNG
jgi:hypothetical protein